MTPIPRDPEQDTWIIDGCLVTTPEALADATQPVDMSIDVYRSEVAAAWADRDDAHDRDTRSRDRALTLARESFREVCDHIWRTFDDQEQRTQSLLEERLVQLRELRERSRRSSSPR